MSVEEVRQQVEHVALVTKQASSISDLRGFDFLAPAIKVGGWMHAPGRVVLAWLEGRLGRHSALPAVPCSAGAGCLPGTPIAPPPPRPPGRPPLSTSAPPTRVCAPT